MGAIWRAEHLVLCAPVAIKLIDPEIAGHEETLARFMREAQSAASLRSPHVVQILDYGVDDKTPFMVMELLEGETLAERLKRTGRLTPAETARFITHVARAINRAHDAGITHRDLKPENVFIVHNEDAEIAKVLDFGVAKVEKATLGPKGERTRTGSLLGTPYYMSPEQAQGNKDVDFRSDLWALGVIAFECLTGQRPFESEGLGDLVLQICVRDMPVPSELAPLPPEFDAWFMHACARDPEERFQSAREMAEALREALGETRETVVTLSDEDRPPASGSAKKVAKTLDDEGAAAEPSSQVATKRDAGAAKAEARAHAATVAASPSFRPSALDAQAAERDRADDADEPAPAVRQPEQPASRAGAILAVAGGALLLGLVGGFIVLGHHANPEDRPLPDVGAGGGAEYAPVGSEAGARHLAHLGALHGAEDGGAGDAARDAPSDATATATEAGVDSGRAEAGPADAGARHAEAAAPTTRSSDAGRRRREAGAPVKSPAPTAPKSSAAKPTAPAAPK
jgi:serine/threonine-protein kinase